MVLEKVVKDFDLVPVFRLSLLVRSHFRVQKCKIITYEEHHIVMIYIPEIRPYHRVLQMLQYLLMVRYRGEICLEFTFHVQPFFFEEVSLLGGIVNVR